MNLLNRLWRHPLISLEPQNLRKKDKNEPRRRTNKMRLKQEKSLRLPEQERQCTRTRSATTRRADRGSPGTRTRSPSPNHRISGLALLLLITTVIPLVEGSTLTQIGSRNITSRICTIWTERSGQPRTRNDKHTEYRTNYNHHWSHIPHHLALNPYTRRRPPSRTFKRYKQLIGR